MCARLKSDDSKEKRKGNIWIRTFLAVAAVVFILLTLILLLKPKNYLVRGESMLPTLIEGDIISFAHTKEPTYGDIVVFYTDYDLLVKRLIGLPGDVISVSADGEVTRNGQIINEPYIIRDSSNNSETEELTVAEGCIFVMGDNRGASIDSRDIRIGQIKISMICGCVTEFTRDIQTGHEEN